MIHKFNLIENILLRNDVIPHPLLDAMTLVLAGRALQVSVKIGLIDGLASGENSIGKLASITKSSKEGLEVLLENLEALGYVTNSNKTYALSKRGKKFFAPDSNTKMNNTILFSDYVFEALNDLELNIKAGGPKDVNLDSFTPKKWEIFNNTMIEIAGSNANEIANIIPKSSSYKKLLDIGGSHGLHSIAYCKKNPQLKSTVFDLAPVEKYANKVIKENNISSRVKFKVGDFFKDELGDDYDVVFSFNIIHGLKPIQNEKLTKKVYQSLNSGGMYVILDQIKEAKGNSQLSQVVSAAQGLMLFNQAGGRTYSFIEVKKLLTQTGFKEIKMKKLRSPGNALIYGFK